MYFKMRPISVLLLLCCFLASSNLMAQKRQCHSMENLQEKHLSDPSLKERMNLEEESIKEFIRNWDSELGRNPIITIPVVFHIIHNGDAVGSGENISNALIQAQLDQMNLDYRAQNSDVGNVPSEFAGRVADFEIQFCLASTDPDGNSTTGIKRYNYGQASYTRNNLEGSIKPATIWNRDKYLNFWSANFGGADAGLLGYAQFPGGAASTDGVVCTYSSIGSVANPNPAGGTFNLGRTATHEVGHWLNLRHIWGDDSGSCNGSDQVSDTPNQGNSYGGCPNHPQNSCSSNDMFMNYMDYVSDACMYMFTTGQKARAIATLNGSRSSLLTSDGCGTTTATCSDGIQNQGETGVDCGGPCAACTTPCSNPTPLACNSTINGNSASGADIFNSYATTSGSGWTGPEVAYSFTVASAGEVTIDLTGLSSDIDLFLSSSCDNNGILQFSYNSGSTSEQITRTLNPGTYYLIIDGYSGASSSFNLSVSCASAPSCNDGVQNGNETGVDCGGSCTACASCNDGIQNQGETGVDCGGPCSACPTCNDGIQNQGETGVDCGGPCTACATCNDGIQNQGETGVDCGGPCAACPTCNDGVQNGTETGVDCGGTCGPCTGGGCTDITIALTLDNYPDETTWSVADASGTALGSGGPYARPADNGQTKNITGCLDDGCYYITLNDAYGDGFCCGYGNGSLSITIDATGTVIGSSNGQIGSSAVVEFCIGSTSAATCSDGIQNQGEAGVDCGGPCTACASCNDGVQNQGETGVDCGGPCSACPTCNDGVQNQGETGVDCGGPCSPCAVPTCAAPLLLACNTTVTGSNGDGANVFSSYTAGSSQSGWNGPEVAYEFSLDGTEAISISLSGLGSDIDLFLTNACDPNDVIAFSYNSGTQAESISQTLNAGTYHIIIDGYGGTVSNYSLSISCAGNRFSCADGIQNGDETGIDCGGSCGTCPLLVSPKVFLQGAFKTATNEMTTNLSINELVPTTEPFSAAGYAHKGGGGESTTIAKIGANDIVDWMLVELRDANDPSIIVATRSALLRKDGQIVDTDGVSAVAFPKVSPGDYYISVRHRNHLGIMTSAPVNLN